MLVMFFVFHILVLALPFFKVSSVPLRENSPDIANFPAGNVQSPSFQDDPPQNSSSFHTQKPMFQIIKNLTRKSSNIKKSNRYGNLKSNIFDKMLSEEMLSIKQRFFDKDLIQSPAKNKLKQNSAPTPTVEVQQKWSVVELFTNPGFEETSNKPAKIIKIEKSGEASESDTNDNTVDIVLDDKDSNNKSINVSANKVLELRSLPSLRHDESLQGHQHVSPKCSCTRQAKLDQECTHTVSETTDSGIVYSYTLYPLYVQPYQQFYFSDNIESPYHMYSPKKSKHRKTTQHGNDLYYEDNEDVDEADDGDDGEFDYTATTIRHKSTNVIVDIDYDLVDEKPTRTTRKKGYVDNNLLHDLNQVYNEGVKKTCYCSEALKLRYQTYIFYVLMIAHMLKYFHGKILLFE